MPLKSSLPLEWRLQSSKRTKGNYFQAVYGQGKARRCVTLGYLSPEEAEAALKALRAEKGPLLANVDADGQAVVSDDGIRQWATEVAGEAVVTAMVAEQARVSGDYSRMPLSTFVSDVYLPVRHREVSASTQKNDRSQWRKINPIIGSLPLKKITGLVIERLVAHYASDTAPTRRQLVLAVRACLKYAESIGVIETMPKIRPIKGGMQRVKGRPTALTSQEVSLILDQASYPTQRALWAYALGQGLRPSEAVRLDWADVDWTNGVVLVRGTKTAKSHRRVPLTTATKTELEPYWISLGKPSSGWAFPNREDKHPPSAKWGNRFKSAAKRAGITKVVTAYTARHTFATACAMSGVPLPAAREMLGHTSHSRTLEEVYSNPDAQMLAAAVAGLTKLGG